MKSAEAEVDFVKKTMYRRELQVALTKVLTRPTKLAFSANIPVLVMTESELEWDGNMISVEGKVWSERGASSVLIISTVFLKAFAKDISTRCALKEQ